jgi:hypothetical protein
MDENDKTALQVQVEEAKFQLNILKNVTENLFLVDSFGKKSLRPNVKEKDIEMLSEAIVKFKSNYKDILSELDLMKNRETNLTASHSKTREDFIAFAKETGIEIPKFFKDFYQIDG